MRGPILPCVILQSITSEKGLVWIYWLWGARLAIFCFWAYFIYAIPMEWMVYLLPVGRGPQDPVGPTGGPARGHSTHWERQPKPRREPNKPSWFWSLSCTVCHCTVAHAVPVALQHASVHCPDHDAACTHDDHAVPGPAPPRSCGSGGVTLAWAAPPAVTLRIEFKSDGGGPPVRLARGPAHTVQTVPVTVTHWDSSRGPWQPDSDSIGPRTHQSAVRAQ